MTSSDSTNETIAWCVAGPLFAISAYIFVAAFWSRLPMPREWPRSFEGDISKPHVPLSRAGKLGWGLCAGSFGMGCLFGRWWLAVYVLCLLGTCVVWYLDWFWAPGGDSTTFRGRFIGTHASAFWRNPSLGRRTKWLIWAALIVGFMPYARQLNFLRFNMPDWAVETSFWCAMALAVLAAVSAIYGDGVDPRK